LARVWREFFSLCVILDRGKMVIELGHKTLKPEGFPLNSVFAGMRAIVCESVGPIRHEVSVPFHDSQVRGAALLIQTGWDERWGTDSYFEPGPFLGEHLIFRMVRSGVRLAGVDFPVTERSSETRLITMGKLPIVENLRGLAGLPRFGFQFSVLPLESTSSGQYAVHAFAETK
jgi:kynurenine formamidase